MASSYTGLGSELMTTGENAGTWGSKTNTNLQILEQIAGGYVEQAVTTTTTLSVSDGSTGATLSHRVIKFTGTLSANATVTIPLDVQQMYVLLNGTAGAYTLTFKYVSGSGSTVAWAATDKGTKIVYATADHASNPNMVDSGISSTGAHDLDGNEFILDADADTSITADTDDQIDIKIAGADDFQFTANTFTAQSGSTIAAQALTATTVTASGIVKTDDTTAATSTTDGSLQTDGGLSVAADAIIGDDLKLLSDSAVLSFGADSDTTLTHTDGTGLTLNSTNKLLFRDTGLYINSSTDGQLDLVADTEIQIAATTIDINGAIAMDGAITGATNITLSGELDSATLDVSGNADIDGTTNLDAVDIDGAVQIDGAVTVGVDDTGLDVKFFGAAAGAYGLYDQSENAFEVRGATAAGAGLLKLTTGELTVVDADKLGRIDFQAPLEASGTDAILIGASIWAEADDTFAAGVNNTDIVFATGKSEAAAEKFRFTADNEIGIAGANYGTDGQVLTSGGAGAAVAWEDVTGSVTAINNATANELVTIGSTTTELDAEANLTFDGTDVLVGGAGKLQLRDTALFINSSTDGQLDIDADTEVEITTTTVDLNGALDVSGNSQFSGTVTVGVNDTGKDVKLFGATSGSYWLWDESADGVVQIGTLTVGVDDAGHDVKFFGDAASAFMLWDASTDDLVLGGAAKLYLYDAAGGEHISSDGSTLSIAGGGEIDLTATAIDINGTCDISGTFSLAGTNVTSTATELNYSDLTTLGTSAASKVLSADANNLTKISGGIYIEEATLTFDATQDWDVRASPVAKVTLTANTTFDAPSNPTTGQFISIVCIQDGTGSRTIAWNGVFEFTGDSAPTATTTAAKGDMFNFRYNGTKWLEVGRNLNLTLS